MRVTLIVFTAAVLRSSLSAQAPAGVPPKPTLESSVAAVAYALRIDDGKLSGAGAPILETAISQADFVLIGEDHITREIPRFTAAVCDAMGASGGLSAVAFESSPAVADFVQESLASPDPFGKMTDLQKRYPDSTAVLGVKDENDLAAHCAGVAHRSGFRIWGLDQEFVGSAGWILARMVAAGPGPTARAAILQLQATERANEEEARKTGDPSKLFLFAVPAADLERAGAALEKDGNAATRAAFHQLTESREIYLENASGSSDSNARRARLMKHNFLAYYQAAGGPAKPQRVLLKFGDWHLYKGINPLHERDLGNFVAEFADGRNSTSLHIMVLGAKGTHALFTGYARPLKFEPFVMDQDDDYRWLKPVIDAQKTGSWTLYDLRKLRFKHLDLNVDWERAIYGYDLLVIIPELTPAGSPL
jgi:hypothetical protein